MTLRVHVKLKHLLPQADTIDTTTLLFCGASRSIAADITGEEERAGRH